MASRLSLQQKLENISGIKKVYFQPPVSINIEYPSIIYNLSDIESRHANNKKYINKKRYTITLIHKNPDNIIVDEINSFEYCSFDRFYTDNNINYWVFDLFW